MASVRTAQPLGSGGHASCYRQSNVLSGEPAMRRHWKNRASRDANALASSARKIIQRQGVRHTVARTSARMVAGAMPSGLHQRAPNEPDARVLTSCQCVAAPAPSRLPAQSAPVV
eukprot:352159-Chlamydomonas_euryale.AAC.8